MSLAAGRRCSGGALLGRLGDLLSYIGTPGGLTMSGEHPSIVPGSSQDCCVDFFCLFDFAGSLIETLPAWASKTETTDEWALLHWTQQRRMGLREVVLHPRQGSQHSVGEAPQSALVCALGGTLRDTAPKVRHGARFALVSHRRCLI